MQITRTSILTGITRTIDLPVTPGQIARWQGGTLIQTAMPDLSTDDREFIMTGITVDELDAKFKDIDEMSKEELQCWYFESSKRNKKMKTAEKKSACVYVVSEMASDWHKIGMTTQSPTKRLRSFQTGNHRSLFYRCRTPFIPFEWASNLEDALLNKLSWNYQDYKSRTDCEKYQKQDPHFISGGKEWFEYPSNKLEIIIYRICKELLNTTSICLYDYEWNRNKIYMGNGNQKHIKELVE